MKTVFLAVIATLAIAGTARAQEPKAHEHAQPPAVVEQKAGEAEPKDMCMCCMEMKNGDKAMQDKMKAMQDRMQGMKKMMEDKK